MAFDYNKINLPVRDIIPEIMQQLKKNNTLIIGAPPGSGKSTLLPLALLGEELLSDKKIYMLEPRRLAAKTIAHRMSSLLGEEAGQTVGYRIRFESNSGPQTKIEVLTEGILTRMLQQNNELPEAGMIIFDEFHERSIHADLALALAREAQQVLRPDLKIVIMSATLNMPSLSELLSAPVIESKGKQYPVEVMHTEDTDLTVLPELVAKTIQKAIKEQEGDILVFLPGQGEILKTQEILKPKVSSTKIHTLFGAMPWSKQLQAILPDKDGRRKIVLATSIAETSLTIEGIKVVIDSGYSRVQRFDPNSGLSRLETIPVTKDAADQRAGRAGRLSPGVCYRMWTKATNLRLMEHRVPEIMEADLASLMLDLARWGISDADQLTWLTPPPKGHLEQARNVLSDLGALEKGHITEHGKNIHALPCHPRIAHMLLEAEEHNLVALAADLAAIMEERDPLQNDAGIDINLRVEALRRFRKLNNKGGKFYKIEKIASQYRKMFNADVDNDPFDPYSSGLLLAFAYPERIASARPGNNAQFQLANGRIAMAGHKDDLAHEAWLAIASINARDGMGKIFLAAPLNPRDLAPMVKEKEIIIWDEKKDGITATKDLRIGNIILQSKPLPNPDKDLIKQTVIKAIKVQPKLLNTTEEFEQLQSRILSLSKWNPQDNWPEVSTDHLLDNLSSWLGPYLNDVKTAHEIHKINLFEVLLHSLPWDKQQELEKLSPERIEVPSGSYIKLIYSPEGDAPVLSVRLQEVFGMEETPKVNNGKISVLMHLLSPGFKLVQITGDLKSFWQNAYFEVRKDLKGRYPKHEWPENPLQAEAIRGVKRKK